MGPVGDPAVEEFNRGAEEFEHGYDEQPEDCKCERIAEWSMAAVAAAKAGEPGLPTSVRTHGCTRDPAMPLWTFMLGVFIGLMGIPILGRGLAWAAFNWPAMCSRPSG